MILGTIIAFSLGLAFLSIGQERIKRRPDTEVGYHVRALGLALCVGGILNGLILIFGGY